VTPIISQGLIIFLFLLNDEANLIFAKAGAKAYEPVAKYAVAESSSWAHPAVSGRQILVKDKSALALWSLE